MKFTVFTPIYNRAATIDRVYESLKNQTYKDFEWIIVDDGSTDDAKYKIFNWIIKEEFNITYIWQENSHKKTALKKAITIACGELFLIWDSDDTGTENALETFYMRWEEINLLQRDNYIGVTCLCQDLHGEIVGDKFPSDVFDSSPLELFYKLKIKGEKWGFQRTSILRKAKFPPNLYGYMPESIIWNQFSQNYKTRYTNDILRIYFNDQSDSIIFQRLSLMKLKLNADGKILYSTEMLSKYFTYLLYNPQFLIKTYLTLSKFHLFKIINLKKYISLELNVWNKLVIAPFYILGFCLLIYDFIKIYLSNKYINR